MKKGTTKRPPMKEVDKRDVAQSARRVKDKRLRRAYGILDTPCCQCYSAHKGL